MTFRSKNTAGPESVLKGNFYLKTIRFSIKSTVAERGAPRTNSCLKPVFPNSGPRVPPTAHTSVVAPDKYNCSLIYQNACAQRRINLASASFPKKIGIYPFWTWWESVHSSTQISNHATSSGWSSGIASKYWLFWGKLRCLMHRNSKNVRRTKTLKSWSNDNTDAFAIGMKIA